MSFTIEMTNRGVLRAGNWYTDDQLNGMPSEVKRNALILVLADYSNKKVEYFQGFSTDDLVGKGATVAFLKEAWIKDHKQFKNLNDDDLRNHLIVLNNNHTDIEVGALQGKTDKENVAIALDWYAKSKTVAAVIEFHWNLDLAKVIGSTPDVIAIENYDNSESEDPLKTKFVIDKEISHRSSFFHEHGFEVKLGAETKFKAGIPSLAKNVTTVSVDVSTTHNWELGDENTTTQSYRRESDVTVPPGKHIQRIASVTKGNLNVPYRAKVRTADGSEKWIEGTWNGVSTVNLVEKQVNVSNGRVQ